MNMKLAQCPHCGVPNDDYADVHLCSSCAATWNDEESSIEQVDSQVHYQWVNLSNAEPYICIRLIDGESCLLLGTWTALRGLEFQEQSRFLKTRDVLARCLELVAQCHQKPRSIIPGNNKPLTQGARLTRIRRKVILHSLSLKCEPNTKSCRILADKLFKPTRLAVSVSGPNVSFIHQLSFGFHHMFEPGLKTDTWLFCPAKYKAMQAELFKAWGLPEEVTLEEAGEYADEHGLSIPELPTLALPTVGPGTMVEVIGEFSELTVLTLSGVASVEVPEL